MKHYVYIHYRADDQTPFYIGKGSGNRVTKKNSRSEYWKRVASKHGFTYEILEYFETHAQALVREIELIAKYKLEGHTLCNLTTGGDGTPGHTQSPEHKQKLLEINIGNTHNSGKKATEETKALISAALRQRAGETRKREGTYEKVSAALRGNTRLLGHKHTDESKQKMREAQLKRQERIRNENNLLSG